MEIRPNFIHQLTAYENRLVSQGIGPKTSKWTEVNDKTNEFENEELLLRNTYLNAQMGPFADFSVGQATNKPIKVKWQDNDSKDKKILATIIGSENTRSSLATPIKVAESNEKKNTEIAENVNKPTEEIIPVQRREPPAEIKKIIQENKLMLLKEKTGPITGEQIKTVHLIKSNKDAKISINTNSKQPKNKQPTKPIINNFVAPGIALQCKT